MELFGKDITIDLDDRQQELGFYIATALITLLITHLFIVRPILSIRRNQKIYKEEVVKHEGVTTKLKDTEVKFQLQTAKYEEQRESYDELKVKLDNASVQNNAILKEVVQKIVDYLGVRVVSIGAMENSGNVVEGAYEKKYIPYNLEGTGRNISNLFYYLENSEWLLTLKGSVVDITRGGSGEDEKVKTTFKLGAYYPRISGEVSEDGKESK